MQTVHLTIRSIPGGWRLSLGQPGARAVDCDREHHVLAALDHSVRSALGALGPVRRSDAAVGEAEGRAGQLLAGLLATPALQGELQGLLGEARGRGETVALLVDVVDGWRGLPWELLGESEGLEASGQAVIVRRASGHRRPALAQLGVAIHLLEPDDPLSCRRRDTLLQTLATHQVPVVRLDDASVVHVIGHGDRDMEQTLFPTRAGVMGVGTPVHVLTPALRRGPLVVLDVCDTGSAVPLEASSAPSRLLAAGAAGVLAPVGRLSIEAADALSEGVYATLSAGGTVGEAIASGRRAVRALALPHLDGRWWTLQGVVRSAEQCQHRFAEPPFRPPGWTVSGEAAAWVDRAVELARGTGFLGLEHFLATWPTGGGALASHVRFHLAHGRAPLHRVAALKPRGKAPFWVTPRLDRLVVAGTAEALVRVLYTLDDALQALLSLPSAAPDVAETLSTLDPGATLTEQPPSTTWEVLGGPEDGRVLLDGRIGRAETVGAPGLYDSPPLVDPYLSRHVLDGSDGVWTARKALARERNGCTSNVGPGALAPRVGDVLHLSKSTWLRARP